MKENIVSQAQTAMEAEHVEMVSTLNKFLPVLPPAEMEAKKQSIMNAMRLHLAAAAGIGLLGLVFLAGIVVAIYRQMRPAAAAFVAGGAQSGPLCKWI